MTADTLQSLTDRANAAKAAGRPADALALYAQAVAIAPKSGVAEHNHAALLGDLARYAETEAACRRAFAKGLDAPETWLVLARALQGLQRLDEAEAAYREALRRRPGMADTHRDYAQLVWMRSGDIAAATRALDDAMARGAGDPALRLVKARILEYAEDFEGCYAVLSAVIQRQDDIVARIRASGIAARLGRVQEALEHAQRALKLDTRDPGALSALAQAHLAAGQPELALAEFAPLRSRYPRDQFLIALQLTALRMLDNPQRHALLDYASLVRGWRLATPPGWSDLPSYLAELKSALLEHHRYHTHPFGQSVRHGSQAPDILLWPHPAIRAFTQAVTEPINSHLAALGQGPDPARSRNRGDWRFNGVWSVRLPPNGFHANHVHPDGWLSSACYIDLPQAVTAAAARREGWIKFGEPGVPTAPQLEPEHYVAPEPGLLVLFPSYMWHGTVPFSGTDSRLTIAFDLVPATP